MSYKTTVAAIVAAVGMLPFAAQAQDSNFARDRNIAVTQRIPSGYEPLGLKVGAFNVAPLLTIGLQKNDNIYYQHIDKTGDLITQLAPSVAIASDWGRHSISASLAADYESYEKHTAQNTFSWDAGVAGRLDIHGANYAFAGADFSQNYEPTFAPAILAIGTAVRPVKYNVTQANLGFVAQGNRLKFTGTGAYAKYDFFNTRTLSGAPIDMQGRDYSTWTWSGRLDYAVSPDTSIYGNVEGNTRNYRLSSAKGRDSHGSNVSVGTDFDLTALTRGSFQVGYMEQKYKDPVFKTTRAPSFRAKIEYFPTEMTTIHFTANRSIEETPQANASGYLSSDFSVGVDHELLRNFIVMANYEYITDKYKGSSNAAVLKPIDRHDNRSSLNFSGRYLVSRNVFLMGGYTFSELKSHGANAIRSFTDNVFRVSLGLQY